MDCSEFIIFIFLISFLSIVTFNSIINGNSFISSLTLSFILSYSLSSPSLSSFILTFDHNSPFGLRICIDRLLKLIGDL